MDNILDIKNLTVYYDNVCALEHINLLVKKGDFLAILGPNGGGKSTLLKSILGFIKPKEGSIKVCGKNFNNSSIDLGYVPQFSKFDKHFPITVIEVVLCGRINKSRKIFRRYSKKEYDNAENILNKLHIGEFKNRQIGMLSGGQMQRVLIARALIANPEILLLDEPTASLDVDSKKQIYSLLKELNKEKTIIMVSHDINYVYDYANSIACLNKTISYKGAPLLNKNLDKPLEEIYLGGNFQKEDYDDSCTF
ncbi:metal ABC transporter ATP-binding protein [Haloimpatiens sp. FM7315]|uniref:metal ABC transporter ATP-binding protein n=1 Tax=Haloimpatiens sp. FM7315 TaxID=3298609 RepID=UPI00370C8EEB